MAHRLSTSGSPRGWRRAAVAALLTALTVGAAQADIRWLSGTSPTGDLAKGTAGQRISEITGGGNSHFVIQFGGPLQPADRAAVTAAGVKLLSYVGDYAFFASVTDSLNADALSQIAAIADVRAIERPWKLHPDLVAGHVVKWSIVDYKNPSDPIVGAYIMFHSDVDMQAGADLATTYGATVYRTIPAINVAVIELPYSVQFALADEDSVMWIEPPLPPLDETNNSNRARTGADIVQQAPYGLSGAGVQVLVYDGGQAFAHGDLAGRLTIGASDTSGISTHSTHVSGTIAGNGAASGGLYAGMAPLAHIISYGFEQPGGLTPGFLYTDPGDLAADYGEAINTYGADISNNSIGTNTESNGFDCTWQGNYGITSALIDSVVRGGVSGGTPFRIVWANGNERQGSRCDIEGYGDYYSTAPPAGAKNHITVGAMNSNDDSVTSFTSWGPVDDGRMKPDVSAPGCESGNDNGVTSCSSSAGAYTTFCGTSMASPTVCGLSALLIEDFRNNYSGEPDPRNSTLKVIFAQTAVDLVNPGPDYQTGYGSVRIEPAIQLERAGNFLENEVGQSDSYSFVVVVNPGDPEMKVTLAWDDPSGTPNVNPVLVNDLDLVVTSPSGARHYPWHLDPTNPSANATQSSEDHVNNIEQVYVANPQAGGWTVEVRGTNVPDGPQPFSVAASPLLVNCSSAGSARLDSNTYNCGSTMALRVIDCDLNTSDAIVDTVDVNVASTSEPGGETVTLTEVAPEAATFLASLPVSTTNAPGVLLVAEGDTITLTYIDADDGQGGTNITVTDTASVDCTPPIISNVTATNIGPRAATITFDTDEPALGSTDYGTACGSLGNSKNGANGATSHAINLTGLSPSTTYYFTATATDEGGNVSTADNGGACFSFSTPVVPDFFSEDFTSGSDLVGQTITFFPDASISRYDACVEPLSGALPTDPAGGTNLSLSDDSNLQVNVGAGNSVVLYGQSYTSFFVGSNGYVTFGSGDTDYTETFADHFNRPRISGWFDDLNPSTGGTVSWKQLPDRVAVTWLNVPEYSTSNQNTFQIEMYFDGTLTISWLTMASFDGIVGLSEGLGLDPDFAPTDMSALGNCGPRPPAVSDVSVETPTATPVSIHLVGSDDGTPGPLSFIVTSLPSHGRIYDPQTSAQITTTPYTLVNNGEDVDYSPNGSYIGPDSFTYKANDGGTPPDGGDSNTGTVSISVGVPGVVYEFLVDDTNPGWATQGQWAFGQPTGGGSHNFDPTSGFTGNNVYGYNLAGDYPNNLNPAQYLTSGAIDCTGMTQVSVSYYRWLGVESATFDHATFQVSNNGSTWVTIWDHTGSALSDNSWNLQEFDISAVADGQATVYLRWAMGTTDGSVTYPGWNLDDIVIKALVEAGDCFGDLDGDGSIGLSDLAIILSNFGMTGGAEPADGDMDGDFDVDLADLAIFLALFGTPC